MKPTVFLTQLLPLIVFIVVDSVVTDVRISIAAAIVFAAGQLTFTWVKRRRFDWFVLLDVALIGGFGAVSIVLDDDLFFRVKPAVLEGVTVLFMLALVLAPEPFLLGYFGRIMPERALRPEALGMMKSMLRWLSCFTLLHIAVMLYATFHASRGTWAMVSGPGYYVVFVPTLVMALRRRRARPR